MSESAAPRGSGTTDSGRWKEAWQIELLGAFCLRHPREPGRTVARFASQRGGLLLAHLALAHTAGSPRQQTHSRERLVELLWPDADLEAGRLRLRVALNSLRRQLEPPGVAPGSVLIADRAAIRLAPGAVTTDVAAFEAALREAEQSPDPSDKIRCLRQAVERYGGDLLPGYYDEWVLSERQWLSDRYLAALHQLARLLQQAGEVDAALQALQQAAGADPLREEFHRELVQLYARAGRAADARRQLALLERVQREQLGVTPSHELSSTVAQISEDPFK